MGVDEGNLQVIDDVDVIPGKMYNNNYSSTVHTTCLKKNQNAPRPSEHPPVRGGGDVKMFRWDQRLQIQNLFMAFKQVPRWK